jgi:hypothetical protein
MKDTFLFYESYDIRSDKHIIRLNICPRGQDKDFGILLDEDMSKSQMSDILKKVAQDMVES